MLTKKGESYVDFLVTLLFYCDDEMCLCLIAVVTWLGQGGPMLCSRFSGERLLLACVAILTHKAISRLHFLKLPLAGLRADVTMFSMPLY